MDVMVDIETTGTDPAHAAIIQLAAVKFDLTSGQVFSTFDRCLYQAQGRFWDESTREWWGRQNPEIFEDIQARAEDPFKVMFDFREWAFYADNDKETASGLRFWAKPSTFDYVFVESYFRQFGIQSPFHFRHVVDLNSYIRGRGHEPNELWAEIEDQFEGDAHNALFDCFHQIKGALRA